MATATRLRAGCAASVEAVRAWFSRTHTFILDCDGVVWRGKAALPGASRFVQLLQDQGRRVIYLTNNSTKSRATYVRNIERILGITSRPEDVVGSAFAAAAALRARGVPAGSRVYMIGEAGLAEELEAAGYTCSGLEDSARPFAFGDITRESLDASVRAVVIGFDGNFCYRKLAMGAAYLRYGGASGDGSDVLFVATNKDKTFPATDMLLPGGGSLVGCLETGAQRTADVVAGKPADDLAELIASAAGVDMAHATMIGDRLDTDIAFGNRAGLPTALVLTGVTEEAAVAGAAGDEQPTFVADSVAALADLITAAVAEEAPAAAASGSPAATAPQ